LTSSAVEVAVFADAVQNLRMRQHGRRRDPRPRSVLGAMAAAAILSAVTGAAFAAEDARACAELAPGPTHSVSRVLDGETVVLDDGRELRLIGALVPRALDADAGPGTWPMEAAASEALSTLVLAKSIELRFPDERTDRYGRLQAHAFLVEGDARRWVQGALLQQGVARAYAQPGDSRCGADLLAAERPAREARRGLWAEAAYQVRSADNPAELMRFRTTFQVVEGTIVRVGLTRGSIYLNFDRNWRRGFSASLRRDGSAMLGAAYDDNPKGLEGRSVRLRGWIDERSGAPAIDLSAGGLIEVLETPAPRDNR
jgi:endonuclease YncB( thermonuclease family)